MAGALNLPNPWSRPIVSVTVAAECLGMSRSATYRAIEAGDLPTVTRNGRHRVPTVGLFNYLCMPCPEPDEAPAVVLAPTEPPAPRPHPTILAG